MSQINLSDGQVHTANIEYSAGTVAVSIDGNQVTSTNNIDLGSISPATVGFGAFGGVYTENHDILSWSWNQDTTPPVISGLPSSDITATATGTSGAEVDIPSITATDDVDQSVDVVCSSGSDNVIPNSSQTFPLGETTVTCSATDAAGNYAEGSFKVKVTYAWTGLLQPINGGSTSDVADDDSAFKLGSTVPLKFQLKDGSASISDAAAKISVAKVSNNVVGDYEETTSTSSADTGNTFRYDATDKQYIYNLSTKGTNWTTGTYELKIDLGDGTTNKVRFSLK